MKLLILALMLNTQPKLPSHFTRTVVITDLIRKTQQVLKVQEPTKIYVGGQWICGMAIGKIYEAPYLVFQSLQLSCEAQGTKYVVDAEQVCGVGEGRISLKLFSGVEWFKVEIKCSDDE